MGTGTVGTGTAGPGGKCWGTGHGAGAMQWGGDALTLLRLPPGSLAREPRPGRSLDHPRETPTAPQAATRPVGSPPDPCGAGRACADGVGGAKDKNLNAKGPGHQGPAKLGVAMPTTPGPPETRADHSHQHRAWGRAEVSLFNKLSVVEKKNSVPFRS